MELLTPHLNLRPFKRDDLNHLAGLYADPEVTIFTKLGQLTRREAEAILDSYLDDWRRNKFGIYAALLRSNREFAGECGLFSLEGSDVPALRYAFHRRFWGKGLATEAASAVIDCAFRKLGLKRIVSFVEKPNEASHHVTRKLGFSFERITQTSKGALYVYTLSPEQWAACIWQSSAQPR